MFTINSSNRGGVGTDKIEFLLELNDTNGGIFAIFYEFTVIIVESITYVSLPQN